KYYKYLDNFQLYMRAYLFQQLLLCHLKRLKIVFHSFVFLKLYLFQFLNSFQLLLVNEQKVFYYFYL
ncbi:hypothetical protein CP02DC14_1384, partial [Chlamydia psittaci 02DC14]